MDLHTFARQYERAVARVPMWADQWRELPSDVKDLRTHEILRLLAFRASLHDIEPGDAAPTLAVADAQFLRWSALVSRMLGTDVAKFILPGSTTLALQNLEAEPEPTIQEAA